MRPARQAAGCIAMLVALGCGPTTRIDEDAPSTERVARPAGSRLALGFVAADGLTDPSVKYVARGPEGAVYAATDRVTFAFHSGHELPEGRAGAAFPAPAAEALALRFVGAAGRVEPAAPRATKVHSAVGPRARWRADLTSYGAVDYRQLWPGIDATVRAGGAEVAYELQLEPQARVSDIELEWIGAGELALDSAGNLVVPGALGELRDAAPRAYQEIDGVRQAVPVRYALRGGGSFGFELGDYDPSLPLLIDPELAYSSYLGGLGDEIGFGLAADGDGNVFVVGLVWSLFVDETNAGGWDALVAKIDTTQSGEASLVYATYLGGSDYDTAYGIAVADDGEAYVVGQTYSADFPTTAGGYDRSANGDSDAFVVRLDADGALAYASYFGGDAFDFAGSVELDPGKDGYAYVSGETGWTWAGVPDVTPFPTTNGAWDTTRDGERDGFVMKLDTRGADAQACPGTVCYATLIGGSAEDVAGSMAPGPNGTLYLSGGTSSADLPPQNVGVPGHDQTLGGKGDGFLAQLDATGSKLLYLTLLGGAGIGGGNGGDGIIGIDVGARPDLVYLFGNTRSADFPTTANAFDRTHNGGPGFLDYFVATIATGKGGCGGGNKSDLCYATFLGGTSSEHGGGMAADPLRPGIMHIAGDTFSSDFPTTPDAFDRVCGTDDTCNGDAGDVVVASIDTEGHMCPGGLCYATFLGGSGRDLPNGTIAATAEDGQRFVYVTGYTDSTDFPTTKTAYAEHGLGGFFFGADVFLTKLALPK